MKDRDRDDDITRRSHSTKDSTVSKLGGAGARDWTILETVSTWNVMSDVSPIVPVIQVSDIIPRKFKCTTACWYSSLRGPPHHKQLTYPTSPQRKEENQRLRSKRFSFSLLISAAKVTYRYLGEQQLSSSDLSRSRGLT